MYVYISLLDYFELIPFCDSKEVITVPLKVSQSGGEYTVGTTYEGVGDMGKVFNFSVSFFIKCKSRDKILSA